MNTNNKELESTVKRLEELAARGMSNLASGIETVNENNAKFDVRLDGLSFTVSELKTLLPSMNRFIQILNGNGERGLETRIALIEDSIKRIEGGLLEAARRKWQSWIGMYGVIAMIAIWLINLLMKIPKP